MRLVLVPPDTRPPTLDFPVALAQAVGLEVQVPPAEALPHINRPSDLTALAAWLGDAATDADALIISLETLCLGGVIPARRVDDSLEVTLGRLEMLDRLKTRFPELNIYAHGTIVRVAHDDDPVEEKPYYGRRGPVLRTYSEAFDRQARRPDAELEAQLAVATEAVPPQGYRKVGAIGLENDRARLTGTHQALCGPARPT